MKVSLVCQKLFFNHVPIENPKLVGVSQKLLRSSENMFRIWVCYLNLIAVQYGLSLYLLMNFAFSYSMIM